MSTRRNVLVVFTLVLTLLAGFGCGGGGSGSSLPAKAPMPAGAEWTGKWNTDFGELVIEEGKSVAGAYVYLNSGKKVLGILVGKRDQNRLTFKWTETENGAGSGRGVFVMDASGNSFKGQWGSGESSSSGGAWNGVRQ